MIVASGFKEIDLVLLGQFDQLFPFLGSGDSWFFKDDMFLSQEG